MDLHPVFKIRTEPTKEVIELLESVTLGTNGARYKLLDTKNRILESDNPMFVSLERYSRPLGNLTFLRRGSNWYIRYFAFDAMLQSGGKQRTKGDGLLKRNVELLFQNAMNGEYGEKVDFFYAYVDPQNTRSLWVTENFGFKVHREIITQTFSRSNPKKKLEVQKSDNWEEVRELVKKNYGGHDFFIDNHTSKPPFYLVKNEKGELIAFCKMTLVNWEIERLPGKLGGFLTKVLPFIPVLRRIIQPGNHRFLVPEAVIIRENDPDLLQDFFDSILAIENRNLIIWWVDKTEPLYTQVQSSVNWGIIHKLVGATEARMIVRKNPESKRTLSSNPVYITGFDFV